MTPDKKKTTVEQIAEDLNEAINQIIEDEEETILECADEIDHAQMAEDSTCLIEDQSRK